MGGKKSTVSKVKVKFEDIEVKDCGSERLTVMESEPHDHEDEEEEAEEHYDEHEDEEESEEEEEPAAKP